MQNDITDNDLTENCQLISIFISNLIRKHGFFDIVIDETVVTHFHLGVIRDVPQN